MDPGQGCGHGVVPYRTQFPAKASVEQVREYRHDSNGADDGEPGLPGLRGHGAAQGGRALLHGDPQSLVAAEHRGKRAGDGGKRHYQGHGEAGQIRAVQPSGGQADYQTQHGSADHSRCEREEEQQRALHAGVGQRIGAERVGVGAGGHQCGLSQ